MFHFEDDLSALEASQALRCKISTADLKDIQEWSIAEAEDAQRESECTKAKKLVKHTARYRTPTLCVSWSNLAKCKHKPCLPDRDLDWSPDSTQNSEKSLLDPIGHLGLPLYRTASW